MAKKGSQLTVRTATEIQGGEFVILGYAGKSYQMTLDELKKFIGIIEEGGGSVDLTQVSTDILPLADTFKDIGSLEKRWKKIYSTALTVKAQSVDEEEVNIHDGGIEGKIGQDIQWSIDGGGKANFYELTVNGADVATMQYVNNELSKYVTTDTLTKNYVSNSSLTEILKKYYESGYVDFLLSSKASTGDLNKTNTQLGIVQTDVATLKSYFQDTDDVDDIINKWRELEAFLAGQTETSTLADLLSVKANKATTLTGYGITDAKIVDGVITLGDSTITPLLKGSAYPYTRAENLAINKTAVADRWYAVYLSQKGELLVNIPWANDIYTNEDAIAALSDTLKGYVTTLAFRDYAVLIQQNSTNITKLNKTVDKISEEYVTWDNIPTKTSQLTNDSDFLTSQSLDGLLEDYAKKSGYSALKVLATDSDGNIVAHYVSTDKLGFLSNVTSDIQAQINALSIPSLDGYVTNDTLTESLNNLSSTYLSFRGGGTVSGATTFSGGLSVQSSLTLLGVNVAAGSSGLTFDGKMPMYSGDAYTKSEADKEFHPLTTVDTVPTLNSSNLVTSGGVAKAVADLAESADRLYQRKGSYLTSSSTLSSDKLDKNTITIVSTPVALGESITKNQLITNLGLKGLAFKDSIDLSGYQPLITPTNKLAYSLISGTPTLATVATSGNYNDLTNKPTIPNSTIMANWGFITEPVLNDRLADYLPLSGGVVNGAFSIKAGTTSDSVFQIRNSTFGGVFFFGGIAEGEAVRIEAANGEGSWIGQILRLWQNGDVEVSGKLMTFNGDSYIHSGNIGSQSVSAIIQKSITEFGAGNAKSISGWSKWDSTTGDSFNSYTHGILCTSPDTRYYSYIGFTSGGGSMFVRTYNNTTNTGWKQIAFTDSTVAAAKSLVNNNGNYVIYNNSYGFYVGDNLYTTLPTYILGKSVTLRYGESATHGLILNSSGNVTIGSSDLAGTSAKLHVDGTIKISNGTGNNYSYIRSGNYTANTARLIIGTCYGYTSEVAAVAIYNGNVGIGTTNPNTKLHVVGGTKIEGTMTVGSATDYIFFDGSSLTGYKSSASAWSIDPSGNGSFASLTVNTNTYLQGGSTNPYLRLLHNSTNYYVQAYNGSLMLGAGVNNSMWIDANGNVEIQKAFDVNYADGYVRIVDGSIFATYGTSTSWEIMDDGSAYFAEVNTPSDSTKKNILSNIELTTSHIANAPAVSFTWKSSGRKSCGTIAQYWKDVLPEVVSGDEGSYGMNYAVLGVVSSIILARNIETHEQRIERLEKEISDLQKELNALVNNE